MYKKELKRILLIVNFAILIFLVTACSSTKKDMPYQYQIPAKLGDGWKTASLIDVGFDPEPITAMMEEIHNGGFENLHSLLIVKDSQLVFEEYFRGHNQSRIGDVASVTKSVTSIVIGIAIDQGFIERPEQSLAELLPSYAEVINADPLKQQLQLWHILSMTSGFEWDEESYPYGDPRNDATSMERSQNPVQFILNRPVIHEPGTRFEYSGANSMLLSAIVQEATGMPLMDFAKQNLFIPLGIHQYRWGSYRDGHTNTDGGLALRPRDMAKIGQLMLDKGQWNGIQVVSQEWVAKSTQAYTTVMPGVKYGYQWWRDNQANLLENVKSYFAAGYGGQLISVYPDQNMIVVVTGETSNHEENSSRFMYLRSQYILPATIPPTLSIVILWGWFILTTCGVVFIIIEIASKQIQGLYWSIYWLLIGTLFGPLGLGTYLLSYRNPKAMIASRWKALGVGVFSAVGILTGFLFLLIIKPLFFPETSVILLVIPASFLVNWLAFINPITAFTKGAGYWKTLRQTLLTSFISSCFVLTGVFPVLILLLLRWPDAALTIVPFCIMITASGIAGAVVVYPFSIWMVHRNFDFWPSHRVDKNGSGLTKDIKRIPTLRDTWAVFLPGLAGLIAIFGFLIIVLS